MRDLAHVAAGSDRPHETEAARRKTQKLEGSPPFQWLVRAGFAARGITYGVIGALALALALGAGAMGAAPDQQGALALIARAVVGRAALVVICAGLLAYALWKLTQGIFGRGPEGGGGGTFKDRVANLGGGVVYLAFLGVALNALTGGAGSSSAGARQAARGVLYWPGGQLIVALAGAGLIAIALYQLYDALSGHFAQDNKVDRMGERERRLFMLLGRVGLAARALVFALIGYFLVRSATDFNAKKAVGLDGALARLHKQPLGPVLLAVVAAGLLTFAAFSLLEGRYRRL